MTATPRTVVVIGGGQVAAVLARSLRRGGGFDGQIIVVGDEPHLPYQRPPLSKEYLIDGDDDGLTLMTSSWCASNDVQLRLGVPAVGLQPGQRVVLLADGTRLVADAVVIATGGRARQLPGVAGDRIHTLRTLDDAQRLRAALRPGQHVIVIGAGFIGSEVAAAARLRGAAATIVEAQRLPLLPLLGERLAAAYGRMHRDQGVVMRLGEQVETVEQTADQVLIRTTGGARLVGDLVVVGVGISPNVALATDAGLSVDNGVLVDEHCQTHLPHVYAAGDVANQFRPRLGRHVRVEHFDNASRQAAAVAKHILGTPAPADEPHWFWSDQYEHNLQYIGHAPQYDTVVYRGDPDSPSVTAFFLAGGVLQAAYAVDRGEDIQAARHLIGTSPDPRLLTDPDTDLWLLASAEAVG